MRRLNLVGVLFAMLALSAAGLLAQIEYGTIVGVVFDSSERAVPGAAVVIRNSGTGAVVTPTAGRAGEYTSPPLRPGSYTVTVQVSGFRQEVQSIRLEVNAHVRADFRLQVGSVSESITVAGQAVALDTQSAALGNVRTTQAINDLPLNGRDYVQLFTIATGVQPPMGNTAGTLQTRGENNEIGIEGGSVNGGRGGSNDFRYDGIQSQDTDNDVLIVVPSVDAIQEFKVQTNAMDASFGRASGGTVNLVIKSGTNQFHGDAFEFLRNSALDAKNFFDSPTTKIPPFKMNEFGGSLGGPIRKDKTFFFVDYQGKRESQAQTFVSTLPTLAEQAGDFSGQSLRLYDPATTRSNPNNPTGVIRDPFPGNMIPSSRFNATGLNLMHLYPAPDLPGAVNNFLYNPILDLTLDQFDARVDHQINESNNVFGRYSFMQVSATNPGYLPVPAIGANPGYPGYSFTRGQQLALGYVHVFSSNAVYEFRGGWSRGHNTNHGFLEGTKYSDKIGIPGINIDPSITGLGGIVPTGYASLGEGSFEPLLKTANNYQYTHHFSYIRNKQTFHFGYELLRRQFNHYSPTNPEGSFSFNGQFTQNPASAGGTGNALADMLLGLESSAALSIQPETGLRRWEQSWFAQDDIRVTSKLTLNVGIRYEIVTPFTEEHDRLGSLVPALHNVFAVNTPQLPGHSVTNTNFLDFAPRFGFAYSLTPKTIIRSGYGIFYAFSGIASGRLMDATTPVAGALSITNNTTATDLSTVTLVSAGFPSTRPTYFDPTGQAFKYSPRNNPDPYMQQWNFNVQRDMGFDTVLTVGYVGSRGTHLYVFPNINQPIPGPGAAAPRRPYPNLADADGNSNEASSHYHSFQLTGEKRFSKGLSFLAAYTWSHAIDNASEDNGGGPQNAYNLGADTGNSDFDIRHRVVLSWTYQLPVGRGRRYLNGANGVADAIFGGWQMAGIETFMTGYTFNATQSQNTLGSGAGTQRPNCIADPNLSSSDRTLQRWFNLAAFQTPAPYTFGNCARNELVAPGTKQFDISLMKNFRLGTSEQRRLEFRGEFFNIFNTPQFNAPNATIGSAAAGTISSAGDTSFFQRTSRQIQFALKLYF
jgi:Carboxypeptidase regulatory-like domain